MWTIPSQPPPRVGSTMEDGMSAVMRAYELAKSGRFERFTQVKNALRHVQVERALVGMHLAADITRLCRVSTIARQSEV